jgi:hypothetical protein
MDRMIEKLIILLNALDKTLDAIEDLAGVTDTELNKMLASAYGDLEFQYDEFKAYMQEKGILDE